MSEHRITINLNATASTTEQRCPDPEENDTFWTSATPIIGTCSKCGDARETNFTCRSGGHTIRYRQDES